MNSFISLYRWLAMKWKTKPLSEQFSNPRKVRQVMNMHKNGRRLRKGNLLFFLRLAASFSGSSIFDYPFGIWLSLRYSLTFICFMHITRLIKNGLQPDIGINWLWRPQYWNTSIVHNTGIQILYQYCKVFQNVCIVMDVYLCMCVITTGNV